MCGSSNLHFFRIHLLDFENPQVLFYNDCNRGNETFTCPHCGARNRAIPKLVRYDSKEPVKLIGEIGSTGWTVGDVVGFIVSGGIVVFAIAQCGS